MKMISRRSFWYKSAALFLILALIVSLTGCIVPAAQGPTISGSVTETSQAALPNVADRNVDFDGDGVNDYQIMTRLLVTKVTGVMEGYRGCTLTSTEDLHTHIARATFTATFWGTVGDSKPGAMTYIGTLVTDKSNPAQWVITGRNVVVEGSGSGGLEGITGYGVSIAKGPAAGPFAGDSKWEFRFSSVATTATPSG